MKEQSHKDEMSAALRDDFARLRRRGVAATLTPAEEEPEPQGAPAQEAAPDEEPEPPKPRAPEDEPAPPEAQAPEPAPDLEPARERGSILGRLFGR